MTNLNRTAAVHPKPARAKVASGNRNRVAGARGGTLKCKYCPKTSSGTKAASNMATHMKHECVWHPTFNAQKAMWYACTDNDCGKIFPDKRNAKQHMEIHGQFSELFECPACGIYRCGRRNDIAKHMESDQCKRDEKNK